jgi:4-amino-4-deoxy-L-arabinose transferase-like glycosyltransferase
MWMLVFLRNGFLIKLPQFLIVLLGGVSCYEIFQAAGFSKRNARVGMALLISTPVVLAQMNTVYIDVSLAMLIFVSINFLLKYNAAQKQSDLLFCAVSLGIMTGVKFTAIAYAAILIFWLFVLSWKKQGFAKSVTNLLCISPFILTGCFWYIWNIIKFANPIFPFKLQLGEISVFEGIDITSSIMTPNTPEILLNKHRILQIFMSWCNFNENILDSLVTSYDSRLGGLSVLWPVMFLSAVLMVIYVLRKKQPHNILPLVSVTAIMFLVTPENWWTRYTAFIVIVGVMGLIYFIENGKEKSGKIAARLVFAIIILNCTSGFVADSYYLYNAGLKYLEAPANSYFRNQLFDEYEEWLFDNIGELPCSIISFRPDNGGFNFYGANTENKYLWYTYEKMGSKAIDETNAVTSETQFARILQANKPTYVLICEPYFAYHMNYYLSTYNDYELFAENNNEKIYKIKQLDTRA